MNSKLNYGIRPEPHLDSLLKQDYQTIYKMTKNSCVESYGLCNDEKEIILKDGYKMRLSYRGQLHENFAHAQDIIQQNIFRIVPFATIYVVPETWGDNHGIQGCAYKSDDLIILRNNIHPFYTVSCAFHEAWHVLEEKLSEDDLDDLDSELMSDGARYKNYTANGKHTNYANVITERRARTFEHYAMLQIEGIRVPRAQKNRSWAVLEQAWTGELAEKAMKLIY